MQFNHEITPEGHTSIGEETSWDSMLEENFLDERDGCGRRFLVCSRNSPTPTTEMVNYDQDIRKSIRFDLEWSNEVAGEEFDWSIWCSDESGGNIHTATLQCFTLTRIASFDVAGDGVEHV